MIENRDPRTCRCPTTARDIRGSFEEIRDRCRVHSDRVLHWMHHYLHSGAAEAEVEVESWAPADVVLLQIPTAAKSDLRCSGKFHVASGGWTYEASGSIRGLLVFRC